MPKVITEKITFDDALEMAVYFFEDAIQDLEGSKEPTHEGAYCIKAYKEAIKLIKKFRDLTGYENT